MAAHTLADVSAASRLALLTAKLGKLLYGLKEGAPADPRQKELIVRGQDLLSSIIAGARLFDPPHAAEQTSRADLQAYGHALTALQSLQHEAETGARTIFEIARARLQSLAEGDQVSPDDLHRLATFFMALNELFYRDARHQTLPRPKEALLSPASQ